MNDLVLNPSYPVTWDPPKVGSSRSDLLDVSKNPQFSSGPKLNNILLDFIKKFRSLR